jgi:hypothetical protein
MQAPSVATQWGTWARVQELLKLLENPRVRLIASTISSVRCLSLHPLNRDSLMSGADVS